MYPTLPCMPARATLLLLVVLTTGATLLAQPKIGQRAGKAVKALSEAWPSYRVDVTVVRENLVAGKSDTIRRRYFRPGRGATYDLAWQEDGRGGYRAW